MSGPPARPDGLPHAAAQVHGAPVPIGRVIARLARQVDSGLATVGISPAQYRALAFLDEPDAAPVASALAERMSVSRPTITALIDGLVAKALVERHACVDDRRRVEHTLTPKGESVLAAADDAIADRLAAVASHLPTTGVDAAVRGLDRWGTALDRTRTALFHGGAGG